MIKLQDIYVKIAAIKERIDEQIGHPYLLKHIQVPRIDEDKLLLLYSIFEELQLAESKKMNYILTTMLVQVALDTHEAVSNESIQESALRDRQLTVLAGDYYSGLYYHFLAKIDDIPMIRTLAEAIKDVNEHKIKVYRKDTNGIDNLIHSLKMIESSLFRKISDYYQIPLWKDLSNQFLLMKRLIKERELFVDKGDSVAFEILYKSLFTKAVNEDRGKITKEQRNYLLHIYDRYIEHSKQAIGNLLSDHSFVNKLLEERINTLLFMHTVPMKKFVEEG